VRDCNYLGFVLISAAGAWTGAYASLPTSLRDSVFLPCLLRALANLNLNLIAVSTHISSPLLGAHILHPYRIGINIPPKMSADHKTLMAVSIRLLCYCITSFQAPAAAAMRLRY
jgi:hypothetical protein